MKIRFYKIAILLFLTITVTACRKESMVAENVNPNQRICKTYLQQFEAVWEGMNQGYTFWGADTVDWDARYAKYQPIFADFDARGRISLSEYQSAYEGLFEGLLDHHLFGIFYSPKGKMTAYVNPGRNDYYHTTSAAYERQLELESLQKRKDLVEFCGSDGYDFSEDITIPGTYFALLKGKKADERIAYFRFTDFHLMNIYNYRNISQVMPNSVTVQAPLRKFYGPRYWEGVTSGAGYANNDSVVGLIIDLRGNGGGSTGDLSPFIASMSQSANLVGYTRVKDGLGRLDYSPWTPYMIYPPVGRLSKEKPVVVLSDVNSVSCAELATMLIKNLPNGTFIGERTYGAVGALLPNSAQCHDYFYSGCMGHYDLFESGPIFYEYKDYFPYYIYTSTFHMVDKDYNAIEGVGVQPDYEVLYNRDRLVKDGLDLQLENAIFFIKNGRIING